MPLLNPYLAPIRVSLTVASLLALGLGGAGLQAAELSLVEGGLQREQEKDGLTNTTLSLGARYSQPLRGSLHWYAEGALGILTYSAKTGPDPKDAMNMRIGGGARYYFDRFNERITPYASAGFSLASEHSATAKGGATSEIDTDGLYYNAAVGLRFSLTPSFFLDLEAPLFKSALFASTTVKSSTTANGNTVVSSTESSRTEIYGSSRGALSSMTVALGMHL